MAELQLIWLKIVLMCSDHAPRQENISAFSVYMSS